MNRLLESILLALAVFAIIGAIGIVTAILFEISVKTGNDSQFRGFISNNSSKILFRDGGMMIERTEAIEELEKQKEWKAKVGNIKAMNAFDMAIASLKTDEAYQLEYENRDCVEVTRCKDCKWFGEIGCAVMVVDDSDKPTENDYCSFAEPKEQTDGKDKI